MATATKSRANAVVTRKRHTEGFKREALGLAEKIGVSVAARELGLHSSQPLQHQTSGKLHVFNHRILTFPMFRDFAQLDAGHGLLPVVAHQAEIALT